MGRYILRRVLQAIPLLFIISIILFVLMMNMGDPVATMAGRSVTRSADRERLTRQLGLDKPAYLQYLYWLVGNDWDGIDLDGDGIEESVGTRRGILRGDFGTSIVNRGKPVLEVIWDRLPNTLLLMVVAEVVIILGALFVGIYSALRQYSALDHIMTAFAFIGYSMPIFFIALLTMYVFGVLFKRWGLPYLPTVGMFDPTGREDRGPGRYPHDPSGVQHLPGQPGGLFTIYPEHNARGVEPGLHPDGQVKGFGPARYHLCPCS